MDNITFAARLEKNEFSSGETVTVFLRIENRSGRAIELPAPRVVTSPQPVYRLRKPDGVIEEFTPATRARGHETTPLHVFSLPHDAGWEGELNLASSVELNMPGHYEFSARLDWKDIHLEAAPIRFRLRETQIRQLVVSPQGRGDGDLVYLLQRSEAGSAVMFSLVFFPHMGGASVGSLSEYVALPPEENLLLVPEARYPVERGGWIASASPHGVRVMNYMVESEATVVVPSRPMLKSLLPLVNSENELLLLAVLGTPETPELNLSVVTRTKRTISDAHFRPILALPAGFMTAEATLALPEDPGFFVAVLTNTPEGSIFGLLRFSPDGTLVYRKDVPIPFRSTGGQIAIDVAKDGELRAGFLGASVSTPMSVCLVEVRARRDVSTLEVVVSPQLDLTSPIRFSHVRYEGALRTPFRRAALLQTEAGEVWFIKADDAWRPLRFDLPSDSQFAILSASGSSLTDFVYTSGSRLLTGSMR